MILILIAVCEIGFWVVLLLGLTARYLLHRPRLGVVLLACAPVLDLILLVATGLDLRGGGTADFTHALAALYLGLSIAYGHRMVHWLDVRFAYRFAGGPKPERLTGKAYAMACWADVARTLLALAITAAVTFGLTWWVDAPERTAALQSSVSLMSWLLIIDLVWAVGYSIWPRREPEGSAA